MGRRGAADRHRCVWVALPVFRPHWVCPVQGCLCFPRLPCSGSRLLNMERALPWVQFQFSGPPQKLGGYACVLCLPLPQRFRQPGAWAHSPRVRLAFSLLGPSGCCRSGLRKSSNRNRGPVCSVGGGGLPVAESAPFPSPPPPHLQQVWASSSPESLSPSALWTAGSVFGPVNFSLLSHSFKKLPPTALRAFGPVPTPSNAARSSPFCPHLLAAGTGVWGTPLLGAASRHAICRPYLTSPPS